MGYCGSINLFTCKEEIFADNIQIVVKLQSENPYKMDMNDSKCMILIPPGIIENKDKENRIFLMRKHNVLTKNIMYMAYNTISVGINKLLETFIVSCNNVDTRFDMFVASIRLINHSLIINTLNAEHIIKEWMKE